LGVRGVRLYAQRGAPAVGAGAGSGMGWRRGGYAPGQDARQHHFRPGGWAGSRGTARAGARQHAGPGRGDHDADSRAGLRPAPLLGAYTVRSVANFTRQDAKEFLQIAAEIPIRTTVQTFALQEANEALLALKRSEIDGAGVLVQE
jgi:hypothetical protein